MEEDIDIEEHDVLDNPRIRDIFPDLSRVKIELNSDDDDQQQIENDVLQVNQECNDGINDDAGNGNDNLTNGNSDPDDGTNDPYGNENIPGNVDSVDDDVVSDDGNDDPIYGNDPTDNNEEPTEVTDGDIYYIDGINNTDTFPNGGHSYPNESPGKYDPNNGKSCRINDIYSSAIVISDSDLNDNDNLDNDLDSNNDNLLGHENVEDIEGDDEAETSETDIQDDESVNRHRYTILRKLLTDEESDYVLPNKIILGSKPSKKIGKEYQETVVLLEDWAEKLTQSGCFCAQCEILFATPSDLDHHKMSTHSFLIAVSRNKAIKSTAKSSLNYARKSTSSVNLNIEVKDVARKSTGQIENSNKYCHHCNMVFPDHTSLIKHLYELLPIKQFQCNLCKIKFNSQNELTSHNLTHRVIPKIVKGLENQKNIEIGTKIRSFEPPEEGSSNEYQFKCKICHEVLNTYYSCKSHRKEKHPASANKALFIKMKTKTKSNMEVVKTDEKVTTIQKDIKPKINPILIPKVTLFQCKNCKLNFISGLTAALHKVCNIVKSFWICSICNRRFRNEDKLLHKRQHEYSSRFRVYFIVPDLCHKILCRCPDCNLYFEEKHFSAHFNNCPNIPSDECRTCNILVPKTRLIEHTKKHHYFNYKPRDFILITYVLERNLKRKISGDFVSDAPAKKQKLESKQALEIKKPEKKDSKIRLFYCKYCQCCVMRPKPIHKTSKCLHSTIGLSCVLCGINFTSKTLALHSRLHKERKLTVKDFEIISLDTNQVIKPPIPNYPQCQKCKIKFFRLSTKRIHICGEDYEICNICGDSYNSADFQAHVLFHDTPKKEIRIMPELLKKYEMLHAMWNILFHCNVCNVLTDSYDKCVEHSQAHNNKQNITEQSIKCYICNVKFYESCWSKHTELHSRMKITNKDFKVLSFDPKKLLSESWFQIFESLTEKETNQIIDASVYGHERAVKMKLNKPGRSEFTLYMCSNCSICIEQNNIQNHVEGVCSIPQYKCDICNIYFAEEICLAQHQNLHEKGINNDEFRIVSFVVKRKNQRLGYTLYKCKLCNACVNLRYSIIKHTCPKRKVTCYCEICKQSFCYQVMAKHEIRHKSDPNFRAENIKIIPFYPKVKNGSNIDGLTKVEYKVVKAPKMFKRKEVVKQVTKQSDTAACETPTKIDVYKCVKCKVCMLFALRLATHVCLPPNKVFACKKCKEIFPTCTMPRHQARHRNSTDFKAKNLNIINFSANNNTIQYYENESSVKKDKLNKTNANISIDTSHNQSSSTKINVAKSSSKNIERLSSAIFYNESTEALDDKQYTFYKCIDCNVCVSKRSHSSHRCATEAYKHYCEICDIHVHIRHRLTHEKNHEEEPDLNSENIKIIEFKKPQSKIKAEESDLETESRIDSDVEIKMENEIESYEDEAPNEQSNEIITLFKCEDCNVCLCTIQKANVMKHQCVADHKKSFCAICQQYFNYFRIKSHQILHTDRNLGPEHFRIKSFKSRNTLISKRLTFNESDNVESCAGNESRTDNIEDQNDGEIEINNQDLDQEAESIINDDVESEGISENCSESREIDIEDDDDDVNNKMKLYKCTNCNICIHLKASIEGHTCPTKPITYFCKHCKQHFSKTMIKTHKLKHRMIKNLKASRIKVVKFMPHKIKKYSIFKKSTSWQRGELPKRKTYKKDVKNSAKIFKCECGLHFTSEKTIEEHIVICKDNLEISKENCSKCGLLFPTDILVSHLCKHHSKNTEIVVENYSKSLEHSDKETVPEETQEDNPAPEKTIQDNVVTVENENTIETKNTLDTSNTQKSDNNVDTKTLDTKKTKDTKIKPDIYKCQDCNVYFMNQNTCYKHVLRHKKLDPLSYIECKICGLQFSIMTLVTHMRIHHSTSTFDLEKITVEIYYPEEKNKPLKKELYCAGDRVQSLLVSSSND